MLLPRESGRKVGIIFHIAEAGYIVKYTHHPSTRQPFIGTHVPVGRRSMRMYVAVATQVGRCGRDDTKLKRFGLALDVPLMRGHFNFYFCGNPKIPELIGLAKPVLRVRFLFHSPTTTKQKAEVDDIK